MWCCLPDDQHHAGQRFSPCVGELPAAWPSRKCLDGGGGQWADPSTGPACSLVCTVHKVVCYRRGQAPARGTTIETFLDQTRCLHVALAPNGAKHRVKQTTVGKLLPSRSGDNEDVWVWDDPVSCRDGSLQEHGLDARLLHLGEELPAFDVWPSSELSLFVREGKVGCRRRPDDPLSTSGTATFSIDSDVIGALDESLHGVVFLPALHNSLVTSIVTLSVRILCNSREDEEALLARNRIQRITIQCAPRCVVTSSAAAPEGAAPEVGAESLPAASSIYGGRSKKAASRRDQLAEEMVLASPAEHEDAHRMLTAKLQPRTRSRPSLTGANPAAKLQEPPLDEHETRGALTKQKASAAKLMPLPQLPRAAEIRQLRGCVHLPSRHLAQARPSSKHSLGEESPQWRRLDSPTGYNDFGPSPRLSRPLFAAVPQPDDSLEAPEDVVPGEPKFIRVEAAGMSAAAAAADAAASLPGFFSISGGHSGSFGVSGPRLALGLALPSRAASLKPVVSSCGSDPPGVCPVLERNAAARSPCRRVEL
eukprot:TRINITY_DN110698_c0_g1_i1.p1 TRINITY_DN110698_c0_g1~~TRINITY_DN110698_c0_g1_i1.p1  ORF type:complete len:536 (-),score=93.99 TRINITY_DN110698_c0_g1_i1:100-1707(-)